MTHTNVPDPNTSSKNDIAAKEILEAIPFHSKEIRKLREDQALRDFNTSLDQNPVINALMKFCYETGAKLAINKISTNRFGEEYFMALNKDGVFWQKASSWQRPEPYASIGGGKRQVTGADVLDFRFDNLINAIEQLKHVVLRATEIYKGAE